MQVLWVSGDNPLVNVGLDLLLHKRPHHRTELLVVLSVVGAVATLVPAPDGRTHTTSRMQQAEQDKGCCIGEGWTVQPERAVGVPRWDGDWKEVYSRTRHTQPGWLCPPTVPNVHKRYGTVGMHNVSPGLGGWAHQPQAAGSRHEASSTTSPPPPPTQPPIQYNLTRINVSRAGRDHQPQSHHTPQMPLSNTHRGAWTESVRRKRRLPA